MAKDRVTFLTVSENYRLNQACKTLSKAGFHTFHVGSSTKRRDFHDVDLRCILTDKEFETLIENNGDRLNFLNAAISDWLSRASGLPIDFQFQQQTDANKRFKGEFRNYVGVNLPGFLPKTVPKEDSIIHIPLSFCKICNTLRSDYHECLPG